MKGKRVLTVLVATVTVASMLVAPSAAAPKRWAKVLVSQDGHTWTRNLSKPLFATNLTWVPGDDLTRRFYVRNRSGDRARLGMVMTVDDRSRMLRSGQLRFFVKVGSARWARVIRAGGQQLVRMNMKAGAVKPVLVRVQLVPGAGNSTMRKREPFRLKLRLTSLRRR